MSGIKKLASQTLWYGASSIGARLINYLLTPYLTYNALISTADYGRMGAVYSAIPIFNIVFTYGMETAYFRFVQQKENSEAVNNTTTISLLFSTIIFSIILWLNKDLLASITQLQNFPLLIQLSIIIIGLDALSTIPFARIRNEERPTLYAFIKIAGIFINVASVIFFLSYCPKIASEDLDSWSAIIYNKNISPITYVLIANVIQSLFVLLLLSKWVLPKRWNFNAVVFRQMLLYSLPMLVAGMGGMVNETFDRLMLGWWLPGSNEFRDEQRGIYNACYKLSILITLFIQAFRMGAEPFFFKQMQGNRPQVTYARVMKFFVITITVMFLVVALFIPVWRHFIDPKYWEGLKAVPILLFANMFLGIYYNLSVWYKINNKTMYGAIITIAGVAITISLNYIFIPTYNYMACAWTTFFCYLIMMLASYAWGQKEYYIPYATKKLIAYLIIVGLIYLAYSGAKQLWDNDVYSLILGLIFSLGYVLFIVRIEKKEFRQLPYIGRFIK